IGGGIYARGVDAQGGTTAGEVIVTLVGTAVNNNESVRGGAAVNALGSVSIGTSTLSGNKLQSTFFNDPSGVVYLDVTVSGHNLNVADSVFSGNSGSIGSRIQITNSFLGGANIEITRSQVVDNLMNGVFATRVVDSTIARNTGIGASGNQIEILGSTISDNHSVGVSGTDVHIQDSTIRANLSTG